MVEGTILRREHTSPGDLDPLSSRLSPQTSCQLTQALVSRLLGARFTIAARYPFAFDYPSPWCLLPPCSPSHGCAQEPVLAVMERASRHPSSALDHTTLELDTMQWLRSA